MASTSGFQSTDVRCSGKSNIAEVVKNPQVILSKVDVKNTLAPETSGLESTLDAGCIKNTLVPENSELKSTPDAGCIPKNTYDDELDDDMLLLAGKSIESSLEFRKASYIFQKQKNKPKTALEDLERAIAIVNAQPSTSTLHTQPRLYQKIVVYKD